MMKFRAQTISIVLSVLIIALLGGNNTHRALAQDDAECNAWKTAAQTILDDYNQLDESDVVNSVTTLDRLRQQLERPIPEATNVHAALLNMLYLKTMSLVVPADDAALNDFAVAWASEAEAQQEIAIRLVNELCAPDPILTIADFNTCERPNNLGGNMGKADTPPDDTMTITYLPDDPDHACVVQLAYDMVDWTAYWVKLNGADFSPYSKLVFDIKADAPALQQIKLEFRRAEDSEWVALYIGGISDQWQTFEVDFASFAPVSWAEDLSSLENMETLSFVFEHNPSGESGVIYLDNIAVK